MSGIKQILKKVEYRYDSKYLKRMVVIDLYESLPALHEGKAELILFNDGQDLRKMNLETLLNTRTYLPMICIGIHSGLERLQEYGMLMGTDYAGRGLKAIQYMAFIELELLVFIDQLYPQIQFSGKTIAGFSLGGLSALDLAWNRPDVFNKVGVFSGALWWRSKDRFDPNYTDEHCRMMHVQIRNGYRKPQLKFFLQCGCLDETEDRNGNGIIDSIDDTLDLIKELEGKGYQSGEDYHYLQMVDGKHDCETWSRALPLFFSWSCTVR